LNNPGPSVIDKPLPWPFLWLNGEGQLLVAGISSPTILHPKADGQPLLKGCKAIRAEYRANTLAVLVTGFRGGKRNRLCLFDLSEKRLLIHFTMGDAEDGFTLSCNGELLCRRIDACSLRVEPFFGGAKQAFQTAKGNSSFNGRFYLGRSGCAIETGKRRLYLLAWNRHGLAIPGCAASTVL
jgi:hypothetical protein